MRLDHIVQLHLRAVTAPNASLKVAQRRIHAGEIQIDGVVTRLPKQQIIPGVEHVSLIDGTPIDCGSHKFYIMHKPEGVVCQRDPTSPNVYDLIPEQLRRQDLVCVGRLDRDTTGALLWGTDGGLQSMLLFPSSRVWKEYHAGCEGQLCADASERFKAGLELEDGTRCKPATLEVLENNNDAGSGLLRVRVTLHEGFFHQVKRMLKQVGCTVATLHRERFGLLSAVGVPPGTLRELTREELASFAEMLPEDRVLEWEGVLAASEARRGGGGGGREGEEDEAAEEEVDDVAPMEDDDGQKEAAAGGSVDEVAAGTTSGSKHDLVARHTSNISLPDEIGSSPLALRSLEESLHIEARSHCLKKQWAEAIAVLEHVLAVNERMGQIPDPPDITVRASILHNIGFCLHSLRQFDDARVHYEEASRILKTVHTPRPDRYSIGWFYGDVIDNRLRFIKERLIEVQFLQPPESGFLDEWGCKHPKPEEFLEHYEQQPMPPQPPQPLSAADDARERRILAEQLRIRELVAQSPPPAASSSSAAQDEQRQTASEMEESRREWLDYYMAASDWIKASELVVTMEEREKLAALQRMRANP